MGNFAWHGSTGFETEMALGSLDPIRTDDSLRFVESCQASQRLENAPLATGGVGVY